MSSNLLVIIAKAPPVKPLWTNVKFILQNHLPALTDIDTLVYTETPESVGDRIVLLCNCSATLDIAELSAGLSEDLVSVFLCQPELRIYKHCVEPLGIDTLQAEQTRRLGNHIMVFVLLEPHRSNEEAFNQWYQKEHLPYLLRAPTWISSERFLLHFSTDSEAPKYLALHRWGSNEVFDSEEYMAALNTEWRTSVMAQIVKRDRFVLNYEGNLGSLAV